MKVEGGAEPWEIMGSPMAVSAPSGVLRMTCCGYEYLSVWKPGMPQVSWVYSPHAFSHHFRVSSLSFHCVCERACVCVCVCVSVICSSFRSSLHKHSPSYLAAPRAGTGSGSGSSSFDMDILSSRNQLKTMTLSDNSPMADDTEGSGSFAARRAAKGKVRLLV